MSLELSTSLGKIKVVNEVIATVAGIAAMNCYGLVGMASRSQLKDGIIELLGKENLAKGIEVRTENQQIQIDMYVVVAYGTKISEVAHSVQSRVKYTINQILGVEVDAVNIYVQGVRLVNEE